MNTELYLIRHGETEWNKLGRFQGSTDIQLSEIGILQANYLKKEIENKFNYIYASPLSRALKTAQIICEDMNYINPIIVDNLREINFGVWEGLTLKQIKEQYPSEYHSWRTDSVNANFIGGDLSVKNVSIRASEAILDIVKKHIGEKIAIVAHGAVLKSGLIGLFDWNMSMYHRIYLGNTSVTKLTFRSDLDPILSFLNDMSHLPINLRG